MNGKRMSEVWKKNRVWIVAALLGMLSFVLLYGVRILNVTYDDWLLSGGDLSQHYLGWCFFRVSDWSFPIGLMDRIAYPNHVSVIFTDSIPLFAVLFKLLRGILPENFQYFGIWGLLCFSLQGALGALLLKRICKSEAFSVVGSLFFVWAPVELYRMYMHTALGAQWLILLAFLLGFERKRLSGIKRIVLWTLLGFLCGSIHLYFIPMCGLIMCAFLLAELFEKNENAGKTGKRFLYCLVVGAGYCIAALGTVILLGGLSHDHQLDAGGLGQFSFNLNGFLNPQGWSKILPELPLYGDGAGEGLAFPGTGVLLAFLAAGAGVCVKLVKTGKNGKMPESGKTSDKEKDGLQAESSGMRWSWGRTACVIIAAASVIIAVSHRLALGGQVIWEIPYPEKLVSLWGMFRSSGRFIWPVVYLITLAGIIFLCRTFPARISVALLAALLVFQLYDCSPQLQERHERFSVETVYDSQLKSPQWEEWTEKTEHLVFVSDITENQGMLYSLSEYAIENHMTINNFYFAHSAVKADVQDALEKELDNPQKDTLYIYKEADEEKCCHPAMSYVRVDGMIVGTVSEEQP